MRMEGSRWWRRGSSALMFSSSRLDSAFARPAHAAEVVNGSLHLFHDVATATETTAMSNDSCGEQLLDFTTAEKLIIGVMLAVITALTVIGNMLVVIAVCVVKKLRQPSNYLLVSLAVADLSVAVVVMPFVIVTDLTGGKWLFGEVFCNIFIGMDVMCCTASIMTLCVISVDRNGSDPVICRCCEGLHKNDNQAWRQSVGLLRSPGLGTVCWSPPITRPGDSLLVSSDHQAWRQSVGLLRSPGLGTVCWSPPITRPGDSLLVSSDHQAWRQSVGLLRSPGLGTVCWSPPITRPGDSLLVSSDHQAWRQSVGLLRSPGLGTVCWSPPITRPGDSLLVSSDHQAWGQSVGLLRSPGLETVCWSPPITRLRDSPLVTVPWRYLGITRPLTYPARQNGQLMAKMIVGVWLVSASITLPPFCGWAKNVNAEGVCLISQDFSYTIYSTAVAFYIPMLVMLIMYYKIFKAARKSGAKHRFTGIARAAQPEASPGEGVRMQGLKEAHGAGVAEECVALSRFLSPDRRNMSIFKREQKAATTLGVIVGVFSVCWLPFFLLTTARPFVCGVKCSCVPLWVERTLLWFGYANSLMNPFIYAFFNRDLRSTYRDLLRCRYRNINRRLSAVGVHEALKV
ncbi:hypothetical protein P4O66_012075 [Electrophorus voltai]|uniref:5-hydroxytryptamine receptor 7 n=1 Tax=Electrophorus voltai TaxID=2609070 RepID=A0AAD8Z6Q9_9TELE|nr:hypothetical protein P4O66_012075 [Electrophorus voltai]